MIRSISEKIKLANGSEMPAFGFGTYKALDGNDAASSVFSAIGLGYRMIDCASFYKNEEKVGQGISAAISEYDLKREDLFITSKVWTSDKSYARTIESCRESMLSLGVKYLDLLLIHWPADDHSDPDWISTNLETWRAFTDLYRAGDVRAIGVSNFWPEHLKSLMDTEVRPMVNQIEYHPGYMQTGLSSGYCEEDVISYCRKNEIALEAWSPLGRAKVLDNEVLNDMALKYEKSVAQVCLRWEIQHDIVPIPKSVHDDRIAENADVFDFDLDDPDMDLIDSLPITGFSGHTPKDVPW